MIQCTGCCALYSTVVATLPDTKKPKSQQNTISFFLDLMPSLSKLTRKSNPNFSVILLPNRMRKKQILSYRKPSLEVIHYFTRSTFPQFILICLSAPAEELTERLGIDGIALVLQQNRLRWYGHVLHKEDDDWVKKCMEYEVEGPRPRGRPKRTWREVVKEDCQARKLNTEDAMDRSKWKKLIKDVR